MRQLIGPLLLSTIVALCLLSPASLAAQEFPALSGRVVDQADILSTEQEAELTSALAHLEEQATHQLVVATITDLQGFDISVFGYQLGRHWGIGHTTKIDGAKDNGVLLIVAPNERKVRIEVGYGLEGTITDATASQIIRRDIVPKFRADDLPGGIVDGTEKIIEILLRAQPAGQSDDSGVVPAAPLAIEVPYEEEFDLMWEIELALESAGPPLIGLFVLIFFAINLISLIGAITGRKEIMLWDQIEKATGIPLSGGNYGFGSSGFSSGGSSFRSSSSGGGFSGGGGSFGGGGASGSW